MKECFKKKKVEKRKLLLYKEQVIHFKYDHLFIGKNCLQYIGKKTQLLIGKKGQFLWSLFLPLSAL